MLRLQSSWSQRIETSTRPVFLRQFDLLISPNISPNPHIPQIRLSQQMKRLEIGTNVKIMIILKENMKSTIIIFLEHRKTIFFKSANISTVNISYQYIEQGYFSKRTIILNSLKQHFWNNIAELRILFQEF